MKSKFMIFLFIFIGSVCRASEFSDKLLPTKLRTLKFAQATTDEIKKVMGTPKETKHAKPGNQIVFFYNLNGVDFDTTVGFKNGKMSYIYLSNLNKQLVFEDFRSLFSATEVETALKEMMKVQGHERGRYFDLVSPKEGLRLRFQNDKKQNLISATLWQPGQKQP